MYTNIYVCVWFIKKEIWNMLRSGTALIEGIALMMIPDANSVVIDGYCALVVCATIGVGCIYGYAYIQL